MAKTERAWRELLDGLSPHTAERYQRIVLRWVPPSSRSGGSTSDPPVSASPAGGDLKEQDVRRASAN